jgi:hypothetical protein
MCPAIPCESYLRVSGITGCVASVTLWRCSRPWNHETLLACVSPVTVLHVSDFRLSECFPAFRVFLCALFMELLAQLVFCQRPLGYSHPQLKFLLRAGMLLLGRLGSRKWRRVTASCPQKKKLATTSELAVG